MPLSFFFQTFVALLVILQSLPLFAYLKLAGFCLVSVSTNKNAGKASLPEMPQHPPAPLAAVLQPWGFPQLHTSALRRGAPAINFQSIPVWKHWQNTSLPAAALKGFQASDAFLWFWSTTRTFPSICGS